MASTTVEIFFVGLCSFLNMHNDYQYMPPPSVVMHRVDPSMKHVAFIAWNDADVVLDGAANFPVRKTKNGEFFLTLDGEELSLNDDTSGMPTVDKADFDANIASIMKYGDLPETPLFDPAHVPDRGKLPNTTGEAAYLEFGKGTITTDWPTRYKYIFREQTSGTAVNTTARPYNRRIKYAYTAGSDSVVITARKFDNSSRRKLVFKPRTGTAVTLWMGNSMNIDEDMMETPPVYNKSATHFEHLYNTLAVKPTKIYIPVIDGTFTPDPKPPGGGAGTGYCGPDGQP
ncbi:MAG: hypothetical protein JWO97_2077 [Acidobacteria bacterium]|nr:hypothetical protein [Acidobacteriota bacterium]